MKINIKYLTRLAIAIILLFVWFLIYFTITEFRPQKITILKEYEKKELPGDSILFSVLIWNIGYAGLGANMDFFYDGGHKTRDSKVNTENNLKKIGAFLKANDTLDFILLQEVDIASKRTYYINEKEYFDSLLPRFTGFSGINYKAGFVPVPLNNPMGEVRSGIVSYSKYPVSGVTRIAYPGSFSWPKRLFILKRCFLEFRFCLTDNKEFVLINTHNSAFDDGTLRFGESKALQEYAEQEYKKGNYILIGGDFNQTPAGFVTHFKEPFDTTNLVFLPEDFLAGWKINFISDKPSNRNLQKPYDPQKTTTSVIDFFVTSPNIEVSNIKLVDLKFSYSDHQPVFLTFKFIN
jgi:endonuclease/exonuclease/phosphatase family metal-dependent hydrolase